MENEESHEGGRDLCVTNVTNVANVKRGFGKPIERKHIAGRREGKLESGVSSGLAGGDWRPLYGTT